MRIAALTVEVTIPSDENQVPVTLEFEAGFQAGGQPAVNVVAFDRVPFSSAENHLIVSQIPTLGSCTVMVRAIPPALQLPGDCNQDGTLDISDGVCLLNFLFLGTVKALPCGDTSGGDPANVALLDSNGDGEIGLSDAVRVFGYLFQGSPPPALGVSCLPIAGCPDQSGKCASP